MAVLARPLHSKHSLQNPEHLDQCVIAQDTQVLNQAISIDSPVLISNHMTIFIVKSVTYPKRIGMPTPPGSGKMSPLSFVYPGA